MGRKGSVYINGRSVVTGVSNGKALAAPNVCRTPTAGPPIPIPYVSIAQSAELSGYDKSVRINGAYVFTEDAKLHPSRGDEGGTLGGIVSNTHGDIVQPLMFSRDVTIGGKGICRNGDSTWQNRRNALGAISQQQGIVVNIGDSLDEAEKPAELCAICKSSAHATPEISPPGNHARRGSPRIARRLRDNYVDTLGQPKKGDTWRGHPWYVRENSLQGHHLIDCEALADEDHWAVYCRSFGYDINDVNNGVILTSLPELACALSIPLHRGNHNYAPVYDKNGDKVRRLKTPDARREKSPPPFDEVYLCYPEAVRDRIKTVQSSSSKGHYCDDPSNFIKDMHKASRDILQKLASFSWTLTRKGRDFRAGGRGCSLDTETAEENCDQTAKRTQKHRYLLQQLGVAAIAHKLKVGR